MLFLTQPSASIPTSSEYNCKIGIIINVKRIEFDQQLKSQKVW